MNSSRKLHKQANKITLDKRSVYLRSLVLKCLLGAGRGHFGSAMSLIEILRVIYDYFLKYNIKKPLDDNRDHMILSKGHGCLALYAILADKGFFSPNKLKNFSKFESELGGHPEYLKVKGVEASTGALGHGPAIGVGLAIGAKLKKKFKKKIFVIVGDGEINEGSVWEASMIAKKYKLNNFHLIIDYNKIQSYGPTKDVLNLEPLHSKLKSFGYIVSEVNGHDIKALRNYFSKLKKNLNAPTALICHTVKGKGFHFAENNPKWHHKNFFTEKELKDINQIIN